MKILYIQDRLSARGGADLQLISIIKSLPERFDAIGLFGRNDGSIDPLVFSKPPAYFPPLEGKFSNEQDKIEGRELEAILKKTAPDTCHVQNVLNPLFLEAIASSGPAVITVQDHRFFCPGRGKVKPDKTLCDKTFGPHCRTCFDSTDYFDQMFELVMRRLDALSGFSAILVSSNYMKNELVAAKVPEDKIRVVYPFVYGLEGVKQQNHSIQPVLTGNPAPMILFSGRLAWAKGVWDLLEAVADIDQPLELVLAGSGPLRGQLSEKIEKTDISNRVRLPGWVAHDMMRPLIAKSAMTVMPSLWKEPFGLAGLEAQALGRPVIAYSGGGVEEWLKSAQTGLLVGSGDVDGLKEAILKLLNDPQTAAQYGTAGRDLAAEKFDLGRTMKELIDIYDKLV